VGGIEKSQKKRKYPVGSLPGSSRIQVFALPKEGDSDERDGMPGGLEVNFGLLWTLSTPDLGVGCWFPQPPPSTQFLTPESSGVEKKPEQPDTFNTPFEEKRGPERTLLRRFPK
jgi:hypothetical protein